MLARRLPFHGSSAPCLEAAEPGFGNTAAMRMPFTTGERGPNLLVYRAEHPLQLARVGDRRPGSGAAMAKARSIGIWLALAGIALVAQGCREDEQNRPLLYDKGTYQGQPDPALTDQQVEALRQRTAGQKF